MINCGEASDYDKVKKEILYRLDLNPETYHKPFRQNKKRKEDKSPRILLQRLSGLLKKWLRPQELSKVEICDQILLEQFLLDLD